MQDLLQASAKLEQVVTFTLRVETTGRATRALELRDHMRVYLSMDGPYDVKTLFCTFCCYTAKAQILTEIVCIISSMIYSVAYTGPQTTRRYSVEYMSAQNKTMFMRY